MIYILLVVDIILTVAAQLSLRVGALRLGESGLSFSVLTTPLRNRYLFLGLALYSVSFFLYVFILSRLRLNIAYPVAVGTTLALITLTSYVVLKEPLAVLQIIGIAAILCGVFLVLLPQ